MTDWTAGYVSDIEYVPGFFQEQMPAHLDAACLVRGTEPPVEPGEPFRYCELGCGVGETAMAVAAGYARAEVWGFDFNPAHIARGRSLATRGRLANLHLEEASFEELVAPGAPALPSFDYITLHGVWAWISPANRAHVVRFIDRHLKPGGLVYVTYNALPGWNDARPLQRLLATVAGFGNGRSDRRIVEALGFVRQMHAAGAGAILAEAVERLEKERDADNLPYLAHEYLNEHWAPCYQSDVAADLAAAKLSFVASATILENFRELSLRPAQIELLAGVPEAAREVIADHFRARSFRRDIFIRGPRTIPERRRAERLGRERLTLAVPPSTVTRKIAIPLGEAELNAGFYEPALAALGRGAPSVGELMALPDADGSSVSPQEVIGMLLGSRQALAVPHAPTAADVERARAYNLAHLNVCADEGRSVSVLVGAAIGSAVTVRIFEMLAYEALVGGAPPELEAVVEVVDRLLEARGDRLRKEGALIESAEERRELLRGNIAEVLAEALPMWRRIGAI